MGWGHLAGRSEELKAYCKKLAACQKRKRPGSPPACPEGFPEPLVSGWLADPWDVLGKTEVLVLTALDTFGPQPLAGLDVAVGQLATRAGVKRPGSLRKRNVLARLCRRGLVQVAGRLATAGRPRMVYSLGAGVVRHKRSPFKTHLERLTSRLGWEATRNAPGAKVWSELARSNGS
jgi:hypothetical protein